MPWPSDSIAPDSLSSSFGWRYTCGTVAADSGAVFSYDSVGNRTDHGAIITAGDRLASFNGDTITYDDDGNMIRRYNPATGADHRYVWNALGQLDSAIVVSAIDSASGHRTTVTEHYLYDASGRLVHIDGSPNSGWFVYQGDQVTEVVQSQSAYSDVAYDDGTDRPALQYIHTLPSDEWRAQVIDPMGNLAGTVDLDSIGVPHTWDAWGKNTSTTWDGMDALGWKGLQPETGTGLIYMRARWYDPTLGRFISEDPAGLAGGINPYTFAGDDPINNSDPTGLVRVNGEDVPDWVVREILSGGSGGGISIADDGAMFFGDGSTFGVPMPISAHKEGRSVVYEYGNGLETVYSGGSPAWRTNNPGNLIASPFSTRHGSIGSYDTGFAQLAIFPTLGVGLAAQEALIQSDYMGYTINGFVEQYSPARYGNDVPAYQSFLQKWMSMSGSTPLNSLSADQLARFMAGVRRHEGFMSGTTTIRLQP